MTCAADFIHHHQFAKHNLILETRCIERLCKLKGIEPHCLVHKPERIDSSQERKQTRYPKKNWKDVVKAAATMCNI